ncbi:ATP-binding cassette domain-containing protein, partial [Glaciimonas sp. CA11.2]
MLEIVKVRAGYAAINILWDVSLEIERGKLTTIIGPNGAGKTTLLRTIMGLLPVSQGDIRLDGQSLKGTNTW